MSMPSMRTVPASDALGTSSCMRFRMRRNVDLPQPDGPMSDVTWFACISRFTRCSTLCSPNHALNSSVTKPAAGEPPLPTRGGSVSSMVFEITRDPSVRDALV